MGKAVSALSDHHVEGRRSSDILVGRAVSGMVTAILYGLVGNVHAK